MVSQIKSGMNGGKDGGTNGCLKGRSLGKKIVIGAAIAVTVAPLLVGAGKAQAACILINGTPECTESRPRRVAIAEFTSDLGMTRPSKPSSNGNGGRLTEDYQPPDVGGPGQTKGAGTRNEDEVDLSIISYADPGDAYTVLLQLKG
jgi:hypothetical protein